MGLPEGRAVGPRGADMHQVRLWGITRIVGDRGERSDFGGVKPRQLLEVLALHQGEPCPKDALAEVLWEGRPPSSYAATVESHVSVVRRHLVVEGLPRTALATVHSGYVLTGEVTVDVVATRDSLTDALRVSAPAAFTTVEALGLPRMRDLLASSPYASWAIEAREEMQTLVAAALCHASAGALAIGATDRALLLARRAQAEDPVSDATQQTLLRALLALDARCEVLREYADFRRRLREELGVEPSSTTQRLYLDALATSARLDAARTGLERSLLLRLLREVAPDPDPGTPPRWDPLGAVAG